MPDGFVRIRKGERRPLYGQETLTTGTMTVLASPAPTVTLYDANGSAVSGMSGVAASGYDTGAQAAPRVWYNLDTAGLTAGFYTLVFTFSAAGPDATTRVYLPSVALQVLGTQE